MKEEEDSEDPVNCTKHFAKHPVMSVQCLEREVNAVGQSVG